MLIEAEFSKWKANAKVQGLIGMVLRCPRCFWMLVTRADTAPSEFSLAIFLVVYAFRLVTKGHAYWDTSEYSLVAIMQIPHDLWAWTLLALGVGQTVSLFSAYPLTKLSRIYRIIITGFSAVAVSFIALARWLYTPNEPGWIPWAGLALAACWIFVRTRGVRDA
jgi:ABC-type branched-subunit amino acid transport system permease subunit